MKVAIYGFGKEGSAAAKYFSNRGDEVAVLDDRAELDIPYKRISTDQLADYDMVIRSPSVHPAKINHPNVSSVTNYFFDNFKGRVVAVTGTKGKGTTSTLIHKILKQAGQDSRLVGNIGLPAIDILDHTDDKTIAVYEISSFQLWDIKQSPHVAVVLMVESDHLDIHDDLADYHSAKANIVKFQDKEDYVIHHATNPNNLKLISDAKSVRVPFVSQQAAWVDGEVIRWQQEVIMPVSEVGLVGAHNLENICAAISASKILGVQNDDIVNAVKSFEGLEHRLEFVAEISGVKFYNDSFSASTPATIAAISSFSQPTVLIAGGSDKGADFKDLAQAAIRHPDLTVLLMGTTREKISTAFDAVGFNNYETMQVSTLGPIFQKAVEASKQGGIVLLSPGCASFDMFENYIDRGTQFKQLVQDLANSGIGR